MQLKNSKNKVDKMETKDAINIIVTSNMRHVGEAAWWTLFFHYLAATKKKEFTSIFMDELHELFPEGLESDVFHFIHLIFTAFELHV